ncbi:acyl carrier protein [Mariniblastus sp.]|nr:acyl carrier protein [Mariniblastus sp.]
MLWASNQLVHEVAQQYTDTLGIAPGKINADTRFSDLGADSLDTVEMVMELEENFDVNIPEDVAENMQTLGDVVRYIQEQREGQVE